MATMVAGMTTTMGMAGMELVVTEDMEPAVTEDMAVMEPVVTAVAMTTTITTTVDGEVVMTRDMAMDMAQVRYWILYSTSPTELKT